jgi:hypothetical protein
MKAIALLILASSFFVTANAQPNPDTLWTRTYGGANWDMAYAVQQTDDGGYIVVGSSDSFGAWDSDFYLVKTNGEGDTLWTRSYGGSESDYAYSVQQTFDEGYIVAGSTISFGAGGLDFYVVKTDSQGDTLWARTYGGSNYENAYSIQQTADGGYIVAGSTSSFGAGLVDIYLVKTDSQGDTLWTRTYGGSESDYARSVQQTFDGGYIITGYTNTFASGIYDSYTVRTDSQGDTLWTRTYGGIYDEAAYSVQQTSDGGYVLAGYTNSFGVGSQDYYLVKTNNQGDTIWTRTYGGNHDDVATSVQQTVGGYIVAGFSYSFDVGNYDFYLVRTDNQGDTLWTRTYGGSNWDMASSVQQNTDGGYVVAGYTESYGAGNRDFYLVKTGPEPQGSEPIEVSIPEQYALYPNFPNPFNASTQIVYELPKAGQVSLAIFNLLGEEITSLAKGVQSAGTHTVTFDGASLSSGIYFARLDAGTFSQTRKLMLLK